MQAELSELRKSLKDRFELEVPETFSEEEIRLGLEKRLAQLLERNPEEFFQLLYRVDIPEKQMHEVLQQDDALAALAGLVYHRQLQKIRSRLKYKTYFDKDNTDSELKW
ncbi:MAG: hypothetical protein KDC07_03595 [Chitinophagaceae bacterium]|nr:hypothetical protein [Chitinophagaceae bacterium]MCB9044563.1 hypothetical protein [Chitinophagales bacterium]